MFCSEPLQSGQATFRTERFDNILAECDDGRNIEFECHAASIAVHIVYDEGSGVALPSRCNIPWAPKGVAGRPSSLAPRSARSITRTAC